MPPSAGWVPTTPSVVLDAGCGEGYAAGLLRAAWPDVRVVGVDYDAATTTHAARTHGGERAAYLRGALTALPLGTCRGGRDRLAPGARTHLDTT